MTAKRAVVDLPHQPFFSPLSLLFNAAVQTEASNDEKGNDQATSKDGNVEEAISHGLSSKIDMWQETCREFICATTVRTLDWNSSMTILSQYASTVP